jgi:hypothetical protein
MSGRLFPRQPGGGIEQAQSYADDLRVQLAEEQTLRRAAEDKAADLAYRLTTAEQRITVLTGELAQAVSRAGELSTALAAAQSAPPPEVPPPLAYEGYVSNRDDQGRIKRFEILPKTGV